MLYLDWFNSTDRMMFFGFMFIVAIIVFGIAILIDEWMK